MNQYEIRKWGGVAYTNTEGAAIIEELDARTSHNEDGYNSIPELAEKVVLLENQLGSVKKYGYDWIKGSGNTGTEIQVGDELKRVGTLFPGYWVHLYVKSVPIDGDNPIDDIIIISQADIS